MSMTGMMGGTMASFNGVMVMMMDYSFPFTFVGLASGAFVILGAVMLYNRPSETQIWSAMIVAFSLVSILGAMGGFMVGWPPHGTTRRHLGADLETYNSSPDDGPSSKVIAL